MQLDPLPASTPDIPGSATSTESIPVTNDNSNPQQGSGTVSPANPIITMMKESTTTTTTASMEHGNKKYELRKLFVGGLPTDSK